MCEKIWWVGRRRLLLLPDGPDSPAHTAVWDELEDDIDWVEECEVDEEEEVEEEEEEVDEEVSTSS